MMEVIPVDARHTSLLDWLRPRLPFDDIAPASGDASFRRYFRVRHNGASHIVMDAPPDKENAARFVTLAHALRQLGLHTPDVLAADLEQGFLLLSDLGTRSYLAELDADSADALYQDALAALLRLQTAPVPANDLLPPYDHELLGREMGLFRSWYLEIHLGLTLTPAEQRMLDDTFARLAASALEQPRVWVHRDFHSRNLMRTARHNPGVLDFQDAVLGPVTYDLVSLLKDCYIAWPRERVEGWALQHLARLRATGFEGLPEDGLFLRWFDWMGAQRHLKAIGIFARLNRRDGKPLYLTDIPRTLGYVIEVAARYAELADLRDFLARRNLLALGATP